MDNKHDNKIMDGSNMTDKEIAMQAVLDAIPNRIIGATDVQLGFWIGFFRATDILNRLERIGVIKFNKRNPPGKNFDIIVSEKELLEKIEDNF